MILNTDGANIGDANIGDLNIAASGPIRVRALDTAIVDYRNMDALPPMLFRRSSARPNTIAIKLNRILTLLHLSSQTARIQRRKGGENKEGFDARHIVVATHNLRVNAICVWFIRTLTLSVQIDDEDDLYSWARKL